MGSDERNNPLRQWQRTHGISEFDCVDRYGHVLAAGDNVIMDNVPGIVWRVSSVKPDLSPQAPKGVLQVSLVAVFLMGVGGGIPLEGLLKVRDASEYLTPEQIESMRKGEGGEPVSPLAKGPEGMQ